MNATAAEHVKAIDVEAFRLLAFVEKLEAMGEVERHSAPIDLIDIAARLDGNPKAVLFEAAGPEKAFVVGNIMGSRDRLALSMGVDKRDLLNAVTGRLKGSIRPVAVSQAEAPCQQIVLAG